VLRELAQLPGHDENANIEEVDISEGQAAVLVDLLALE